MTAPPRARTRNVEDKKKRIIDAAKHLFAERGYSRTGIKDVAERAGVSASLVILHYRSKRELFREALIETLTHSSLGGLDREDFGRRLAGQIVDGPEQIFSPSMVALSLENDEARRVAAAVARDYILRPTAEWLEGPHRAERAMYIMVCSLGFALFKRLFDQQIPLDAGAPPATWIARSMQRMVAGHDGD